jgi:DHA1 family tetracycline resistance protein-like MFS transporter
MIVRVKRKMAVRQNTKTPTAPEDKLDFKKILPIFVIVLINLLGMTVIIPLMPLYAAARRQTFAIGLLGAAYPVMQFIGAPFPAALRPLWSKACLVDQPVRHFDRVPSAGISSAWMPVLSRIIDGCPAETFHRPGGDHNSTTEKNRTQGLGLVGAAFGLGFVIGPVIAFVSLAASGNDYRVPAFVAAALGHFHPAHLVLAGGDASIEKRGNPAIDRGFPWGYGTGRAPPICRDAAGADLRPAARLRRFEQLLSLFTLNRLGFNAAGNAVIFVFIRVIVVAVQGGFIGPWSRKLGDRRLIYTGLAALAIGLTLTALLLASRCLVLQRSLTAELNASGNTEATKIQLVKPVDRAARRLLEGWLGLAWILAALIPLSIGGGILHPSINSLITKRIDPSEVGVCWDIGCLLQHL